MKTQEIKVGNIGARLDGIGGLWRVDTVWRNGREIEIFDINDKEQATPAVIFYDEFWVLLDSFEP